MELYGGEWEKRQKGSKKRNKCGSGSRNTYVHEESEPSFSLSFLLAKCYVGGTASSQIWDMDLPCKSHIFFNFNLGNQMHENLRTLYGVKFSNVYLILYIFLLVFNL